MNYQSLIREVPDFPIKGVLFRDVSPLLQNAEAFSLIAHDFEKLLNLNNIDLFVGIESRGFIFAAMMADTVSAASSMVLKTASNVFRVAGFGMSLSRTLVMMPSVPSEPMNRSRTD